ncbi:MAG TPA: hypothetical protein VM490_23200 [Armatimonadaceae bacterium]|nr:hypothetical protein [Armatimonadaceae bacterium]
MVRVQYGQERATVYAEGGIGFEYRLTAGRVVGWVVNDDPGEFIYRVAVAARAAAFPELPPLPGQPVLAKATAK